MDEQSAPAPQTGNSSQRLEGIEDMRAFLKELVAATRCNLSIMTQALEPDLFNREDIIEAMVHYARAHRRNRIRIITCDTRRAEQRGHRMVTMAQQLPSYVQIRQLPEEVRQAYPQAQRTWVIADEHHALVWVDTGAPVAVAYWQQAGRLRADLRTFDSLWDQSHAVAAFRRLGL